MNASTPPFPPHIMQCVRSAVQYYDIPQILALSILKVEAGKPGMAIRNTNGTFDLGPAGINTGTWIKKMKKLGISNAEELVRDNTCYNIFTEAWVIKSELQDADVNHPDFWRRAANYHSHTPYHNQKYQKLVYHAMQHILRTDWR